MCNEQKFPSFIYIGSNWKVMNGKEREIVGIKLLNPLLLYNNNYNRLMGAAERAISSE